MKDLTRDGRLTAIVWSLVTDVAPLCGLLTALVILIRWWWPAGHEAQQLSILYYIAIGLLFLWWTVILAKLIVLGVRAFKGTASVQGGVSVDVTANGDSGPSVTATVQNASGDTAAATVPASGAS